MVKPADMNKVTVVKKRKPKYLPTTICNKCGHVTEQPCRSSDAVAVCANWARPARIEA